MICKCLLYGDDGQSNLSFIFLDCFDFGFTLFSFRLHIFHKRWWIIDFNVLILQSSLNLTI